VSSSDPLANPAQLIRRVYGYVAYLLGDGPLAEDVTSDVFERALRYRDSFDPRKGSPVSWLLGIARRCSSEALRRNSPPATDDAPERSQEMEDRVLGRLSVAVAVRRLPQSDQELIALRYGADLSARQIAALRGTRTNAIEVALHRALKKLRADLEAEDAGAPSPAGAFTPGKDSGLQPGS
jgi:RNA polymerase sigma factor (sigma-70 family)